MKFGLILDDVFREHETPPGHPERPDRIRSIASDLRSWNRFEELTVIPPAAGREEWARAVHSPEHLRRLEATRGFPHTQLDPDTHTSAHSLEIAYLAAGSVVKLLEGILAGTLKSGFAVIRPPGHHAESSRAMGFCLLNNVAIAAEWAHREAGLSRIAIVDFDVHHGNGTQEIFYNRGDVLYISTHQHPLYPGTGMFGDQGTAPGEGGTVNFPISADNGNEFYLSLFDDFIGPILRDYRPEVLLVSAGYDAHRDDPLAGMRLDEAGFSELSARLNQIAAETCDGRILYLLEGGYNLDALAASVRITLSTWLDRTKPTAVASRSAPYLAYRERALTALESNWQKVLNQDK